MNTFKFKKQDNRTNKAQRSEEHEDVSKRLLMYELKRAAMLGSLYNESTFLRFLDDNGFSRTLDKVVTAITEKYVLFRGGLSIPIGRIQKIIH